MKLLWSEVYLGGLCIHSDMMMMATDNDNSNAGQHMADNQIWQPVKLNWGKPWLFSCKVCPIWKNAHYSLCISLIAVCKDSYMIYVCGFDQVGKWSGFTESLRITIKAVISRHVCHWLQTIEEVRPYCFYGIIGDSQWFAVILSDSQTTLKLIWGDSQWFTNHSDIIFGAILGNLWTTLKFI